jgi:hypothetical protein
MRSTWTDSRLDDFSAETGRRFDRLEGRLDTGLREVRDEIGGVRSAVAGVRSEVAGVRGEVAGLRKEILALHRTIIVSGAGMFAALLGLTATQV